MLEVKAPGKYPLGKKKIFLAGSIEMGLAPDWQKEIRDRFVRKDILFLNPRRDNWDDAWHQDFDNENFREQVEWEMKAQEDADIIVMNLVAGTKSPISLMEMGLFKHKKMLVCCPDGFWRKGNVKFFCERFGIPLFDNFENLLSHLSVIV